MYDAVGAAQREAVKTGGLPGAGGAARAGAWQQQQSQEPPQLAQCRLQLDRAAWHVRVLQQATANALVERVKLQGSKERGLQGLGVADATHAELQHHRTG